MTKKIILLLALIFFSATNVEAADENLPFDTIALATPADESSILALIRMKSDGAPGAPCFMVMAKNIDIIGFVPYSREIYDFYLNESPLISVMAFPNQQRAQVDDELGDWDEDLHIIPFYALFEVQNGQVICQKPFSSARGLNPSHYHGRIKNTDHERLIEILMILMPQLHQAVESNNISLP